MKNIVLIGIGQKLRGDDAIGPAAVEAWEEEFSADMPSVRIEISQLPGLELLGLFENADVAILVDAVQSGDEVGTVHIVGLDKLISFGASSKSVHGFGVAETLALGQKVDPKTIPDQVIIIGIEAKQMNIGQGISPEILGKLPEIVTVINKTLQKQR